MFRVIFEDMIISLSKTRAVRVLTRFLAAFLMEKLIIILPQASVENLPDNASMMTCIECIGNDIIKQVLLFLERKISEASLKEFVVYPDNDSRRTFVKRMFIFTRKHVLLFLGRMTVAPLPKEFVVYLDHALMTTCVQQICDNMIGHVLMFVGRMIAAALEKGSILKALKHITGFFKKKHPCEPTYVSMV